MSQRLLYLGYDVKLRTLDAYSFENYDQSPFPNDINQESSEYYDYKNKFRGELANYISTKIGSISSVYLLPSQTRNIDSKKGLLVGKSGGRKGEDCMFEYDIHLLTIKDSSVDIDVEDIYNQVWDKLDGEVLTVNVPNPDVDEVDVELNICTPKSISHMGKYASFSSDNLTSTVPSDIYQKFKIDENFIEYAIKTSDIASPQTLLDDESVETANDLVETYSDVEKQVETIKNDYDKHGTKLRKPEKSEIDQIVDSIIKRFEKISEDGYVYLQNVPEEWDNSKCGCKDCSNNSVKYSIARKKLKNIFLEQMEEAFGITSTESMKREPISGKISNFYLDELGNVYFRPEEVISWIVDHNHYVESYCKDCHKDIITNFESDSNENWITFHKHNKIASESKKSDHKDLDGESASSKISLKETESISIDVSETNSSNYNWIYYRKPTGEEFTAIVKAINYHIKKLGSRGRLDDTDVASRRKDIYNTIMKRKRIRRDELMKYTACENCGRYVDESIQNLDKHHPVPVGLKRLHHNLVQDNNIQANESPILVNNETNEFVFTDKILWRIESLLKNTDIATFMCSSCSDDQNTIKQNDNLHQSTLKDKENKDVDEENIGSNLSKIVTQDITDEIVEFECAICSNEYQGRKNSDGYISLQSGSYVPITENDQSNRPKYIGLCAEHKQYLLRTISKTDGSNAGDLKEKIALQIENIYNK